MMMGAGGGMMTTPHHHGGGHHEQQQHGHPSHPHQHGGGGLVGNPQHDMDGGGGYPPQPQVPGVEGGDATDDGADDADADAALAAQREAEAEALAAAAAAEEEADRRIYNGSASKTCLIFVMDAQDEPYDHVLQHFVHTVTRAVRANPAISVEVFINKVDGELFLSDEAKYDCRRDIMQQVSDELHDAGLGGGEGGAEEVFDPVGSVNYHLTSIYDHSIFEAFSRVVQKLIPHLQPTLENLLNVLVSSCSMEKAYLFDVASKLYISTDSSPVDMQSVELCSDMIDVVLDVSGIYGTGGGRGSGGGTADADEATDGAGPLLTDGGGVGDVEDLAGAASPPADDGFGISSVDATATSSVAAGSLPRPSTTSAVGGPDAHHASEEPQAPDGTVSPSVEGDGSAGGGEGDVDDGREAVRTSSASELGPGVVGPGDDGIGEDDYNIEGVEGEEGDSSPIVETAPEEMSAYDDKSSSVIRLSNGMVLYLREVDSMLALVCLTRCENFRKRSLIDYNISRLKRALKSLVVVDPSSSSSRSTTLDGTALSGMNGSAPSAAGR